MMTILVPAVGFPGGMEMFWIFLIILVLFGALGLGMAYTGWHQHPGQRMLGQALIAAACLVPGLGMYGLLARTHFVVAEMPIHSNLATQAQYKQVGLSLKDAVGRKTVLVQGEIGTLAYYCDCYLLDEFSDRRWLNDGVAGLVAGQGPVSAVFRLNFRFLRQDPGFAAYTYLLTVRGDASGTDYPHMIEWQTSTRWLAHNWIVLSKF